MANRSGKEAEVLANIDRLLQEWDAMDPKDREAEIRELGTPTPDIRERLEFLRDWRANSKAVSMTRVS